MHNSCVESTHCIYELAQSFALPYFLATSMKNVYLSICNESVSSDTQLGYIMLDLSCTQNFADKI